jgi:predicted peroxiredoxin
MKTPPVSLLSGLSGYLYSLLFILKQLSYIEENTDEIKNDLYEMIEDAIEDILDICLASTEIKMIKEKNTTKGVKVVETK